MEKIDLVIPTYNRPQYLIRILDYYDPFYNDFNFIIADSSKPDNKKKNIQIIKDHPNMNILHLKYPPTLSQHDKFAKMAQRIRSKYCVFCADDDFLVPNGVKKCVKFLKNNPDYAVAHGSYISFYSNRSGLLSRKFYWRHLFSFKSNSSNSPTQRIYNHLSNFTLVLWAVSRTDVIKKIHKEFTKVSIDPYLLPVYGELLPDCLTVAYGKVKRINTFYSARQSFDQILSFYPSLIDARKKGIYEKEYFKVKNSLLKNLKLLGVTDLGKASKIIDAAFENYEKSAYQEHLLGKIRSLLSHTPKLIQKTFNDMHLRYLFSKPSTDVIGDIDKPDSKYYQDFLRIKKCVLNH